MPECTYMMGRIGESNFLVRVQRRFRIQTPQLEYGGFELKRGSVVEVDVEEVETETPPS